MVHTMEAITDLEYHNSNPATEHMTTTTPQHKDRYITFMKASNKVIELQDIFSNTMIQIPTLK